MSIGGGEEKMRRNIYVHVLGSRFVARFSFLCVGHLYVYILCVFFDCASVMV